MVAARGDRPTPTEKRNILRQKEKQIYSNSLRVLEKAKNIERKN